MEDLLIAIVSGFLAGAIISRLSNKAKNNPVFKSEKLENSKDILHEARKAHELGADSAAILLAFGAIESKLREKTKLNDSTFSINKLLEELNKRSEVDESTVVMIRQLANIRNQTVHSSEVSKKYTDNKVESYLHKAQQVLKNLSQINL
ncbi:hypothetical protein [Vibrio vulnificus]|uniref:hypothetical protein n=1 Tax=Vibrio vulnificus TaxID=672 RepID=UPI0019D49F3E|nr:hypothetical protein [Vibrio vulnificus]MBN8105549.1 hypothetical protein [Vibrio vulnificus]